MADEIDQANDQAEKELERAIKAARGYEIPPGKPGECAGCGIHYMQLANDLCSGCRADPLIAKLYGL